MSQLERVGRASEELPPGPVQVPEEARRERAHAHGQQERLEADKRKGQVGAQHQPHRRHATGEPRQQRRQGAEQARPGEPPTGSNGC